MARGGARQGRQGATYSNRTDLNAARLPATGAVTPASGGLAPPPAPAQPPQGGWVNPDHVTAPDAPTDRPNEPVTHGLAVGPGGGPEAMGAMPVDPTTASIQAAYLRNPTPQLRRALYYLMGQGAL